MNEIPDAYKEAAQHVEKPKKSCDEKFEQWNVKKMKQAEKNLVVTRTSFFVPYDRKKKSIF